MSSVSALKSRSLDRATSEVIEFKRDTIRHIVDDLVRLEDMNIPTIMMNLKERAKRDLIYTNVGSILVSVNPYQMLPIYTPAVMEQYRRQIPNLPPHPFSVADQCYRALFEEKKNQAILVSGESGAGKTEAVKVVLQYLAEAAGSSSGVEQKILLANPMYVFHSQYSTQICPARPMD
jgi:myosin-7